MFNRKGEIFTRTIVYTILALLILSANAWAENDLLFHAQTDQGNIGFLDLRD